jgi:hypothetical protein
MALAPNPPHEWVVAVCLVVLVPGDDPCADFCDEAAHVRGDAGEGQFSQAG